MKFAQVDLYAQEKEPLCRKNDYIEPSLYVEFGIKRGLRDVDGNGVRAGLTNISRITSFQNVDGVKTPCDGQLWYRGYQIADLVNSLDQDEMGFEKVAYLLLMGELPEAE